VRLAETGYRDVNIGLANEFARYAQTAGVNIFTVIEAANSQPFSHIHQPGAAVGGHSIPVYPHFYLSGDPQATIVRAARACNASQPAHISPTTSAIRWTPSSSTPITRSTPILPLSTFPAFVPCSTAATSPAPNCGRERSAKFSASADRRRRHPPAKVSRITTRGDNNSSYLADEEIVPPFSIVVGILAGPSPVRPGQ
jgi:hypothetical protein